MNAHVFTHAYLYVNMMCIYLCMHICTYLIASINRVGWITQNIDVSSDKTTEWVATECVNSFVHKPLIVMVCAQMHMCIHTDFYIRMCLELHICILYHFLGIYMHIYPNGSVYVHTICTVKYTLKFAHRNSLHWWVMQPSLLLEMTVLFAWNMFITETAPHKGNACALQAGMHLQLNTHRLYSNDTLFFWIMPRNMQWA